MVKSIDKIHNTAYCAVVASRNTAYYAAIMVGSELRIFGSNLKRLRSERRITQEKLAELADLNIRTLQKIEAGQTNILITTAYRLHKALGCDWDDMMVFIETD